MLKAAEPTRKELGAFYTPAAVAETLVKWVVRRKADRLLDPSCGDGEFLRCHANATGVEMDHRAIATAHRRAPRSRIHSQEFFAWISKTTERFDCIAGNPPFIRYQRFSGTTREAALAICRDIGIAVSALSSSWVPFIAASTVALKPGGRMAFVVPAEIGHAPYAAPLIEFLAASFSKVQIVAVREKLFPALSEDAWLLVADGFQDGSTSHISFSTCDRFVPSAAPPSHGMQVSLAEWRQFNRRLRPFLLDASVRSLYRSIIADSRAATLGAMAQVGIGYVTGANQFFHLKPSEARSLGIPSQFLVPSVLSARSLGDGSIDSTAVAQWHDADASCLLLRLRAEDLLPKPVRDYLASPGGIAAQTAYKCRHRKPWYVVPDVRVPHAFLSYMSGRAASLVANRAGCTCSNTVHGVTLRDPLSLDDLIANWDHALTRLSCEIEGHPLGGGMLKLEPREAGRILLASTALRLKPSQLDLLNEAVAVMRRWRHYG